MVRVFGWNTVLNKVIEPSCSARVFASRSDSRSHALSDYFENHEMARLAPGDEEAGCGVLGTHRGQAPATQPFRGLFRL